MVELDNMNLPVIATVGLVSVVATVVVILLVQAVYQNYATLEFDRKVVQVPVASSDSRLAEQEAALTRYRWVDRDNNIVTIPIDRAMRLVVQQLRLEQENDDEDSLNGKPPRRQ